MRLRQSLLAGSILTLTPAIAYAMYCGVFQPPPQAPACNFYVAASGGSDSNPGTQSSPFATITKLQTALQGASSKIGCIKAGTYAISAQLSLTSPADNGETWQFDPASGYNTAVLDGGNTLFRMVNGQGVSNVTWNGIKIDHTTTFGIEFQGGGSNDIIENSEVADETSTASPADAVSCSGVPKCFILHNYVHDIAAFGIAVYAFNAGDSADGDVVDSNVCLRCDTSEADTGAIYSDMHFAGTAGGKVTISNNYVSAWAGTPGNQHAIYLDDSASNETVVGNVIAPPQGVVSGNKGGTSAIFLHNGESDTIKNNIIDVGNSGFVPAVSWGFDGTSANQAMTGNLFQNNILISAYTGTQSITQGQTSGAFTYVQNASTGKTFLSSWLTISGDAYHNYSTGTINTSGNVVSDSSPNLYNSTQIGVSCPNGNYTIVSGSTVTGAPVNFPQIKGGWGPPGFVVNLSSHSC